MTHHIALAFISGVVIEALYALGVLFIGERRGAVAGLLSVVWGVAFLVGVNESFRTHWAAVAWCVGLGVGTVAGVRIKPVVNEKTLDDLAAHLRREVSNRRELAIRVEELADAIAAVKPVANEEEGC